jgi:amino acid transporter
VLGSLGFIFSLLFKMAEVITAIIVMRIVVQFMSQAVGVIIWHRREKERPWRMPLFPLPAILSLLIWLGIFLSSNVKFIGLAAGIIALGLLVFYLSPIRKAE